MSSLAYIPLAAAVILACGILYFYRGSFLGHAERAESACAKSDETDALKEEVRKVRLLAAELTRGRLDIEWSERQLEDKSKRLDLLINKAEETLRKAASAQVRTSTDNYSKAGLLLEMGLPADEIKSRLGLLNGEVELIESLNRCGKEAQVWKKTPQREYSSRPTEWSGIEKSGHVA
ncbi:MAG: DUF2802 domain-containing protein [Deltaproteobacteria bacterium]|nr:DUF2802 domain-containing protein [Deltaproteobacteria bacterium]